jgi:hypothetical protein
MVSGITPGQFKEILNEIGKNHCLIKGRAVKYVDSSFDFRTRTFWRIEIRPFGTPKEFTVVNRPDDTGFLFDEIMDWLDEGRTDEKSN